MLVEKPMAPSLKECDAMLEAEKEYGVTMGTLPRTVSAPALQAEKRRTAAWGRKVRCAHVNSLWCERTLLLRFMVERHLGKEGVGGPTLNHAVHHIDMINWIQGRDSRRR